MYFYLGFDNLNQLNLIIHVKYDYNNMSNHWCEDDKPTEYYNV